MKKGSSEDIARLSSIDERTSEEKQAMLASIVSSSEDAIISKTLDGIITSWNRGAENIFGHTEKEAIGRHISLIIPPERIQEEVVIIQKIRNGERLTHFETVRVAKNGQKINVSLTVSPVKNRDGIVTGASKIARDITEKVEAELQRQHYTQRLKELNKYKDEFMAMASHELKTPLTVIKANLQILEHKMQDNGYIDFVKKTLRSVNKLTDLITDLLEVSKIQSGKLELNLSVFDLNELLKETIDNTQETTNNHKIILDCGDKKLIANADKERIGQVIINLLSNAVKYSPEAESIRVNAWKEGNRIIVSVADSGIGIPDPDLENIFSRFYRVRGMASTFSGSGIGLYISSEIIKRHDGFMWAESKEGKGSTFYFSLPAGEGN